MRLKSFTRSVRKPLAASTFLFLALAPLIASDVVAQDWPRWMGPRGDGAVQGSGLIPAGGRVELREVWRRPVGAGYSSVSVAEGRAYTLTGDFATTVPVSPAPQAGPVGGTVFEALELPPANEPAPGQTLALAVSADDGRELWRVAIGPEGDGVQDSGPLSTPTVAEDRVFVVGQRGMFRALAAGDGRLLWSRDLREMGGTPPSYGFSTSPWVEKDRVVVLVGGRDEHNLVAFDAASGEIVWSVNHGELGSYSSPVAGELDGRRQLIVPAGDKIYAVDGEGEVLWSHEGLSYPDRNPVILPGDRIFMPLEWEGVMLTLKRAGERYVVEERWRTERFKDSYGPAVFFGGALFSFDRNDLTCLEAETGERRWSQKFSGGSLILVDGHLLVLDQVSGKLHLVRADPESYEERAVVQAFDPDAASMTPPAWAGGRIYLRSQQEMVAYEVIAPDPKPASGP